MEPQQDWTASTGRGAQLPHEEHGGTVLGPAGPHPSLALTPTPAGSLYSQPHSMPTHWPPSDGAQSATPGRTQPPALATVTHKEDIRPAGRPRQGSTKTAECIKEKISENVITPIKDKQHCTAITFQLKVNFLKKCSSNFTGSTLINISRVNFQDKQLCS